MKKKVTITELIDKAAIVKEIKRLIDSCYKVCAGNLDFLKRNYPERYYSIETYKELLSFLDTLEVKEVELDFQTFAKEMDAVFSLPSCEIENTEEEPLNWEYAIAKHFYELGLKAKGE